MRCLFDMTLLREQIKRYWAISALMFLALFFGCLLPMWGSDGPSRMYSALAAVQMENPTVLFANILGPFSAVAVTYSYMYGKSSAGVMHSLPFTKKQLFATNFLAGYLLVIVPLAVFSLLLIASPVPFGVMEADAADVFRPEYTTSLAMNVFPGGLQYGQVINSPPVALGFFARALLSYTFYYAVFTAAAMVVGNAISYMLVAGVFSVLAPGLYVLYGLTSQYFVYGYALGDGMLRRVALFTMPVFMMQGFTRSMSDEPIPLEEGMVAYYIGYALIAAALLALSARLYRARRLERAGDTVVFMPLKTFLIFLASAAGMVLLGLFMLMMLHSVTAMYFGFAVGFVIAFFVAQMIAEKTFNVLGKYKALIRHGAFALGIYALIAVSARLDIMGYARHIPDVSEIAGVSVSPVSGYGYGLHGTDGPALDLIYLSDPDIVAEAMRVHQNIIGARHEQRAVFLRDLENHDPLAVRQTVTYRLKNGETVLRQYTLSREFADASGMTGLKRDDRVILTDIFWANAPEFVESIDINDIAYRKEMSEEEAAAAGMETAGDVEKVFTTVSHTDQRRMQVLDSGQIRALCGEIKKDYVAYVLATDPYAPGRYDGGGERVSVSMRFRMMEDSGLGNSYYTDFEGGANTLRWLEANGYGSYGDIPEAVRTPARATGLAQ